MPLKEKLVESYKKILKFSIDLTNIILTFILYFFGVSISNILWRLKKKKEQSFKTTYWLQAKPLPKKLEEYYEQY